MDIEKKRYIICLKEHVHKIIQKIPQCYRQHNVIKYKIKAYIESFNII